jgi:hypothetical protein
MHGNASIAAMTTASASTEAQFTIYTPQYHSGLDEASPGQKVSTGKRKERYNS